MRSALTLVPCLVVLGLAACSTARDPAQTGTTFCFNCHSETSALGIKIKWAEAGYDQSVHKQGPTARLYTEGFQGGCPPFTPAGACTGGTVSGTVCTLPASTDQATCVAAGGAWDAPVTDVRTANGAGAGPCPFFAVATAQPCELAGGTFASGICQMPNSTNQTGCETAGGVWVGPRFSLLTVEHEGTDAFYANSGGCQMCHTQEGFRKRVAGTYDPSDGSYSIKFGWSTQAWVGSPSKTPNTPLTADVIVNPSPLGCFGCHTPHGIGTTDNVSLDQTIPEGTAVTTQTGAVYGNATTGQEKATGHICAECHQVRINNFPSVSAAVVAQAVGGGDVVRFGPHHGPQTDMLLGKGGAEYTGTAGAFTFNGTYSNSPHTTLAAASCVTCHMQSDFEDIDVTQSFAVSASVGGHSFTNKGVVHGAEKALAIGCGTVVNGVGCHTVDGVAGSSGPYMLAATFTTTTGYLQKNDAYFEKHDGASKTTPVSPYLQETNELLTHLADPSRNCRGLLDDAAGAAGVGHLVWQKMPDGYTTDPRCIFSGATTSLGKSPGAADDNTNASVRFLKGLWNFQFVLAEDKSFSVHNTTYAQQLLYDSCMDLALLTSKPCGADPGRCSFCEGKYITDRPD